MTSHRVGALGPPKNERTQQHGFRRWTPIGPAILAFLGGYAGWYRQEKVSVGCCGVGRDTVQVLPANAEVPDRAKLRWHIVVLDVM